MINLLPPSIKKRRLFGRRNISLLGYSASLLITALATAGIMLVSLQIIGASETDLKNDLAESQAKILLLEKDVKAIESVAVRLATAKKISDQSVSFSELIPKIGAVLPEGVILNGLSLSGGITDPLQLDVNMTSASLAPIMIRNLVESDLFEAADISTLSPIGVSAGVDDTASSYTFTASITASFTGTAEAAKALARAEAAKAAAAAAKAAIEAEK